MTFSRRQFAAYLGVTRAALLPMKSLAAPVPRRAEFSGDRSKRDGIVERRVYDRGGAVPPAGLLERCGMAHVHRSDEGTRVELAILFGSFAERTEAWDRLNSDPEWCALREQGEVRLVRISFEG